MCVSNNRRFACNKAAGRLALPGALIKIDDDGVVIRRTNRGSANVAPLRSILFQKVLFRPRGQLGLLDKSHEKPEPIMTAVLPEIVRIAISYTPVLKIAGCFARFTETLPETRRMHADRQIERYRHLLANEAPQDQSLKDR
jgi:hypothetical protein